MKYDYSKLVDINEIHELNLDDAEDIVRDAGVPAAQREDAINYILDLIVDARGL